jgi:Flp pilus assembly protein TadG
MFLFVGMLIVGGLAIDLVRAQTIRVKLQSVADNAVLAAVTSAQMRDRNQVVRDYFEAAGLGSFLVSSEVDSPGFAPEVTAEAKAMVPSSFLRLVGITGFPVHAKAKATEAISAVEVSLVLDISGSMRGTKLSYMKDASSQFVEAVYRSSPISQSHISIVPYAAHVSAGDDLLRHLNVTGEHSFSHCIDFEAADFARVGMPVDTQFRRAAHFDPYSNSNREMPDRFVCNVEDYAQILAYSNDVPTLLNKIDSLVADGNTSIDTGMKWGAALLDLDARPLVQGMINDGVVAPVFTDRPVDPEEYPGIKIVVLMTDGQNTAQYRLKPQFRNGLSDVWMDGATGRLSVKATVPQSAYQDFCEEYLDDGSSSGGYWRWLGWRRGWSWYQPEGGGNCWSYDQVDGYFAPHNDQWYEEPYGNNAVQLTYPELWNRVTVEYHAYIRYQASDYDWSVRDYWENEPVTEVSRVEKDQRLLEVCDAARDAGTIVYTIAVEAPTSSETLLRDCATSPSYAFDVDRFDIDRAFGAIITSVNSLRLTL